MYLTTSVAYIDRHLSIPFSKISSITQLPEETHYWSLGRPHNRTRAVRHHLAALSLLLPDFLPSLF
jgi:hypothetical protein